MAAKSTPSLIDQIHYNTKDPKIIYERLMGKYTDVLNRTKDYQKKVQCLERKRNVCNKQVKRLYSQSKTAVGKRDDINEQVKHIKSARDQVSGEIEQKKQLVKKLKKDPQSQSRHNDQLQRLKERGSSLHNQVKLLASESSKHHSVMLDLVSEAEREKMKANDLHKQFVESKAHLVILKKEKQQLKRKVNRSRKQMSRS
ncbi:MAG: hypothetical protein GPJ54_06230 [Candidatus Heimdallarchaeota archaeon]|nr:hypothetical protein [Candidatus Heimdallarchaeota archaeon]